MAYFGRGKEKYELIGTADDPIPDDEPCLLIRAQDEHGAFFARLYAFLNLALWGNPRVAESVKELADLMEVWPTKKRPDL